MDCVIEPHDSEPGPRKFPKYYSRPNELHTQLAARTVTLPHNRRVVWLRGRVPRKFFLQATALEELLCGGIFDDPGRDCGEKLLLME